jgi:hypothetical protein
MIRVNVSISSISAERFLDIRQPLPQVQINTNFNLTGMEKKPDGSLEFPFVVTIVYNPSVAQISLKGRAYVIGEKGEIEKISNEYNDKKPPPPLVMQSVANVAFIESIMVSRTLNVPPPIPLPQISQGKPVDKKLQGRDYSA